MIKTARLLFPFTHGLSADALEQAIMLANNRHATLVPVSLLYVPEKKRSKGPRLEMVEQSQDFLESVRCRAARSRVPVEQMEIVTSDVVLAINGLAREMDCEGILLFMQDNGSVFLDTKEARQVMQQALCRLYVFHLKTREHVTLQVC